MKKIALLKCFFVLIVLSILILNCSKDSVIEEEIIKDNNSTLIDIFTTISNDSNTILDIAPIPVFDELANLDNEYVDQVLESISKFNDLLKNPMNISGSTEKSGRSSMDYDTCITFLNYTECTFFRDKGDYSITVKQEISPMINTYEVYFSGIFEGVDYGNMYLLQDQVMGNGGKVFSWEFYRPPSPPWFANQKSLTIQYNVFDNETTIYTPWGTFDNQESVIKTTNYMWDDTTGSYHPAVCNEMISKGNILQMKISTWSYKNEVLFYFWVATWDWESHSGTWITFDEDGIVQETGSL